MILKAWIKRSSYANALPFPFTSWVCQPPFGRSFTYIKYVDPDPKYDQSPRWAQIDQGPETFVPERVQIGYKDNFYEEPMIDSGFGPYALSRICYETGGIFFTIHPNRNYERDVGRGATEAFASHLQRFFEPEVMERYRPDYLSAAEYQQMLRKSRCEDR